MSVQEHGFTNNVLSCDTVAETTFFVPVYIRIKLKNIVGLDFKSAIGVINASLLVSIFYGDLHETVITDIENKTALEFSRHETIYLGKDENVKKQRDSDKKLINFTIRKQFKCKIDSDIFWTPFEIVNVILSVTLHSISGNMNGRKYTVKFNTMDCDDDALKISFTHDGSFGQHDLAEKLTLIDYSN